AGRLVRLLEAAAGDPDQAIGRLDILTPAERHTILHAWNDTAHPVPSATVPQLFEAQAARTPDAVAAVFEDERLTYGELNARANQLAHHLRSCGVGPETVVGLCVERSLEMMVGLLGILKAGGAYLPLDPSYPQERLAFMLADAGATLLLTQSALRECLPEHTASIVRLDADWPAIAQHPATSPANLLQPHNLAYVIYTSGSTGAPKGVMVEHASLTNKVVTLGENFGAAPDLRVALLGSSAFDPSIEQTILPLTHGASIAIISNGVRDSPSQFWDYLLRAAVNVLDSVPSYLAGIIGSAPDPVTLDHLVLGGESFDVKLHREISSRLNVARITNLYGPTET